VAPSIHTLTIPSSTLHLEDVRRFVETHAVRANFNEEAIAQLKMAVDEACTNVIEHAYHGDGQHQIDIAVILKPDRFTVRIRDEGERFKSADYQEPDLLEFAKMRRAGGFGVHIMRRLMDKVEYRTDGNVNECCLIKYRQPDQNGETKKPAPRRKR
jgi:serine/threonine-protein kinase RsbW